MNDVLFVMSAHAFTSFTIYIYIYIKNKANCFWNISLTKQIAALTQMVYNIDQMNKE